LAPSLNQRGGLGFAGRGPVGALLSATARGWQKGGHERPGGDHVQRRNEHQPNCPYQSPRSCRNCDQAGDEGSLSSEVDCRPSDPVGKLGSSKPRRRPRPHRKGPIESLEDRNSCSFEGFGMGHEVGIRPSQTTRRRSCRRHCPRPLPRTLAAAADRCHLPPATCRCRWVLSIGARSGRLVRYANCYAHFDHKNPLADLFACRLAGCFFRLCTNLHISPGVYSGLRIAASRRACLNPPPAA